MLVVGPHLRGSAGGRWSATVSTIPIGFTWNGFQLGSCTPRTTPRSSLPSANPAVAVTITASAPAQDPDDPRSGGWSRSRSASTGPAAGRTSGQLSATTIIERLTGLSNRDPAWHRDAEPVADPDPGRPTNAGEAVGGRPEPSADLLRQLDDDPLRAAGRSTGDGCLRSAPPRQRGPRRELAS